MGGKRTPYNRIGEEAGASGVGGATFTLSAINSLLIVGLAAGVIITGVFLGQTRGDVNTLQAQLSNVTVFDPQILSFVDTPARFNETTANLWTAVVATQGYCVTYVNFSVCSLTLVMNASYTESPAPSPGSPVEFRVIGVFPAAFPYPDASTTPELNLNAVIFDASTNATVSTLCNAGPLDIGTDIHVLFLLPTGSPTNTPGNSVIMTASEAQFTYVVPK